MASIDGLAWCAVASELSAQLLGSRVDKVFQPSQHTIVLSLRQPGQSYFLSLSGHPAAAGLLLLPERPETPAEAPAFCMLLRKHLEGSRLLGISQPGFDRLLVFSFASREESGRLTEKELILELTGRHSNLIFVRNGVIGDAVRRVGPADSRRRLVLPGQAYETPPLEGKLNLATVTQEAFCQRFAALLAELPAPRALCATLAGIGPATAKELLAAAGTANADPASLARQLWPVVQQWQQRLGTPPSWQAHLLLRPNGKVQALVPFAPQAPDAELSSQPQPSMLAALAWLQAREQLRQLPQQPELSRFVQGELSRLARKQAVLAEESVAAAAADSWRLQGDLLMAQLHLVPAGATEVRLPDLFAADGGSVVIPLDPARTPSENAQYCYQQYGKSKRRFAMLAQQLAQTAEALAYLDSVLTSLQLAATAVEITEIRQELTATGFLRAPRRRQASLPPSQPLQIPGPDGSLIWVGRNNRQNDELTFRRGKPGDLWLHAKDIPGSHVLVQAPGGEKVTAAALELAAMLAAYFSKGREAGRVPVDYTERRHVKKPAGAKPGFVIYTHQTTLSAPVDAERLQPYLEAAAPRRRRSSC